MKRRSLLLSLSLLLFVPTIVSARSSYLTPFRTTYPAAVGSALDSCTLCHTSTPATNPYGDDYAANAHSFTAIAGLDSDGDGFSNADEIAALTYPGNVTSTPAPPPDTTSPTVPTGLRAVSTAGGSVSLAWNASTDDVGVTRYLVLRDGAQIGNPTGTTFTDSTVAPSTSYSYTVRARDAAGNTSGSSVSLVVITPTPSTPVIGFSPASLAFATPVEGTNPAPADLVITNDGAGTLSWTVSTADVWLQAAPGSGSDAATVSVSVDVTGLPAGVYQSSIAISAAGAANSPRTVPVTLTIGPVDDIPSLKIARPRKGMALTPGANYRITWETTGYEDAVSTRLFLVRGTERIRIASLKGNPGRYRWQVPDDGGRFRIQVVLRDATKATLASAMSARFSIGQPGTD